VWGETVDADIGDKPARRNMKAQMDLHLVNYDGKRQLVKIKGYRCMIPTEISWRLQSICPIPAGKNVADDPN
jgi:hypothetical protein